MILVVAMILFTAGETAKAETAWLDSLGLLSNVEIGSRLTKLQCGMRAEQQAIVERMRSLLDSTSSESLRAQGALLGVVDLLTEFGGKREARSLASRIDYFDPFMGYSGYDAPPFRSYPFAIALSTMGMRALDEIMWTLVHPKNELELRLSTGVLERIFGPGMARCIVSNKIEDVGDDRRARRNLEKALLLLNREDYLYLLTMSLGDDGDK